MLNILSLSFTFLMITLGQCYKPVIIVHGVLDGPEDLSDLKTFIQKVLISTQSQSPSS